MSLLDNFPHKCKIARKVRQKTSEGMGFEVDRYSVEQTDVSCWEQQLSASESSEWEKRGINVQKKIFFTEDPGLNEDSLIIITERNGTAISLANQLALDVVAFPQPDASAGLGILYRVIVKMKTGSPPNFLP